ncbi:MAG: hypothetical protein PHC34_11890 [Candidatus Gastranaerophilales bacterium]|nr:hypothetical protein [Candidatus Gastranaerophilales bacterium]
MWHNIIFILIVVIIAFVGFTNYSLAKDNNANSALEQLSKSALVNKLEQLPDESTIKDYPPGAMCYRVAAPPERVEYICPVCGEMTLYPIYYADIDKIPYYRTLVKKITKINVTLDESPLCKKCSPNIKSRELCLIVKYDKNAQPHKTCDITDEDINLLYEYSEGIKEHRTSYGKEPLNNYKGRLEELFGVSIIDLGK